MTAIAQCLTPPLRRAVSHYGEARRSLTTPGPRQRRYGLVVAVLAPWVGYHSETRGRRPLLLLGFAMEPLRAALLAVSTAYPVLVVAQVLDGFSGAIITVLTVLVITD
jgi:hypothetical protein